MTSSIQSIMAADHRACDHLFADAERAAGRGEWGAAGTALVRFRAALDAHLDAEEEDLFPRFEAATGITHGPTGMMRMEHGEMRALADELQVAIDARDRDGFAGQAETLLILMQQHNMKEEQMLYPMCDARLPGGAPSLAARLRGAL